VDFASRRQILRAYGNDGRLADALIVEGVEAARRGIAELFARPEGTLIHSRNVLYGCFMFPYYRR
jgi:hypothetical protein